MADPIAVGDVAGTASRDPQVETVMHEVRRAAGWHADPERKYHGKLFRKYLLLIFSLVTTALLASGAVSVYFSYKENKAALATLQQEKANAAAARIEQYVHQIEQQLAYAALPQLDPADVQTRRLEFLKLLRQAPEVTDIAQVDATGHEQIAVSRLGMDSVASGKDRSQEPAFRSAKPRQPWFGPVYFRKETEPYMTIAIRSGGDNGPVTVADVNLKFIWDVVSRIRIGEKGKAYVVDGNGFLVADPDIGLVLRKTNLGELAHVKTALARQPQTDLLAKDFAGATVLTSYAAIEPLDWTVLVEQPISEVYAQYKAVVERIGLLLLAGLVVSALGALALARGMVRPIRTLDEGARRIGAGDLDRTIEIRTGDELQALADQFNRMTAQLRESYAGLERKVDERTRELKRTLEQQTAISEILRVIAASPADAKPVLREVASRAAYLCEAATAHVALVEGDVLRPIASYAVDGGWVPGHEDPLPLKRTSVTGRAVLDRNTITHADILPLLATEYPDARSNADRASTRAILAVPMMRDGDAYGVIVLGRRAPGAFSSEHIALLETFARQAAIAIDNVRLFNETREALDQQRASGEVLATISSSIADATPVFEKIVSSCERLFSGKIVGIRSIGDDGLLYLRAYRGPKPEQFESIPPNPVDASTGTGSAILARSVMHYPDVDAVGVPERMRQVIAAIGIKALVFAPMLWEDKVIGAIFVGRPYAGPFSEKDIALLKTFADQAAIAIQNARLFGEIRDKSRQLEIANKHKSEFLANMSHELRTPLNAVIGFSEVLLERLFGDLNEKQDDYLKDIHSSGKHLLSLINDILDLSKVEAGRMELEPSTFDITSALSNAITLVRERAQRHGILLGQQVEPGLGDVTADERKFKQILVNLLSNAVKFTPDGGRIDVNARRDEDALVVSVHDTGIGIAKEDQDAVFEEFRQVGRAYTNKQEGTGLGLSLTKRFVELHGGRLWVESELGKGSTFTFTIPVSA
jgi:signal transduction histidine kinase/HAMP domain-containing protein